MQAELQTQADLRACPDAVLNLALQAVAVAVRPAAARPSQSSEAQTAAGAR